MNRTLGCAVAVLALFAAPSAVRAADPAADEVQRLKAELEKARQEVETLKKRTAELEKLTADLTLKQRQAEADKEAALAEVQRVRKLVRDLFSKLDDSKAAPVAPDRVRATVTAMVGTNRTLLTVSSGIDAGLSTGMELDVYRLTNRGGTYLGTAVVEAAFPKTAFVQFKPASGQPLDRLKADELPNAGDIVVGRVQADKRPGR